VILLGDQKARRASIECLDASASPEGGQLDFRPIDFRPILAAPFPEEDTVSASRESETRPRGCPEARSAPDRVVLGGIEVAPRSHRRSRGRCGAPPPQGAAPGWAGGATTRPPAGCRVPPPTRSRASIPRAVAHVLAAVIVPGQEPLRDAGLVASEQGLDPLPQGLHRLESLGAWPGSVCPPLTRPLRGIGQPPAEQGLYLAHFWRAVKGASPTPVLTLWRPAAKLAGTVR
jgi:hypothetical protein